MASSIRNHLYEDIISGQLPPGAKLNMQALCVRFGTTLSPVREALNRLAPEGLVRQTDHRGFAVSPVSVEEVHDITKARCWINEVALRDAIANVSTQWEEGLILANHRLSRTPRSDSDEALHREWSDAHRRFHAALVAGCSSKWVTDFCDTTFVASERYRHIGRRSGKYRFQKDGHTPIMEAALACNADQAVALLNEHFAATAQRVTAVLLGE